MIPRLLGALLILASACGNAAETNLIGGFAERAVIETWGWHVAQQEGVAGIEISKAELAAFTKGFSASVRGESPIHDLAKAGVDLEDLMRKRRAKLTRAIEEKNELEAKAFFAGLKKNTNVTQLPGGLSFELLQRGNGVFPKPQQTVTVHYTGRLLDGTEFIEAGPVDMVLVTNRAPFAAWVDGLQRINPSGVIKFYVPPPLTEKEARGWNIAPGSGRVFEVQLLAVRDSSDQELADATMGDAPEPILGLSGYSALQLIEAWGWQVGQATRAAQFHLSNAQLDALTRGAVVGVEGKAGRADLAKITPVVEQWVNEKRKQVWLEAKQKRRAEMESLFAELAKNTNVVTTPSGLRYDILQPGSGPHPDTNQTVKVNYVGSLVDGRVFDRTDPTLGPLDIKLSGVIPGWSEGIQKIGKGGKIKLYLPPPLGYGSVATGGIPADSTLIFEIELLDVMD